MNGFLRTLFLFGLLTLLGACGTPQPAPEQRLALEEPAMRLQQQGAFREAALAWQQAASQAGEGEVALSYRLNAADALVQGGDSAGAQGVLGTLPPSLPPSLAVRRALVGADIALLDGDPARALSLVGPAIQTTDAGLVARYRFTRAEALLLSGDALGSARELTLLDGAMESAQGTYANRQRIWARLKQVPSAQLAAVPAMPPEPFSGWVELASLSRSYAIDADALDAAIAQWNLRYPGHSAGEQIVPELQELVRAESQPPTKIALLLPQSGPFASAGAHIRDGFMAAWFADAPNPRRPEIVVVDTGTQAAVPAYLDAVAQGAQMVVGPLTKQAVSEVLGGTVVPVTTIALNYPSGPDGNPARQPESQTQMGVTTGGAAVSDPGDSDAARRTYFFALSPEDEAARVGDYAREQGAIHAGVLAPAGEWGERVAEAFSQHWRSIGGTVSVQEFFLDEPTALSDSVYRLLNLEASKQRARAVRRVIARRMAFYPQPRSDLDFIFLAAFPTEARQVKPLLAFHRAENIPVIATSHLFSGTPDPDQDQDVDGVIFGDMPWLITPEIYGLPDQVKNALPDARGTLARLYAFGADAYALVGQLPKLRNGIDVPYPGLTGRLSLGEGHRIRRDLEWARFTGGAPVSLSAPTESLQAEPPQADPPESEPPQPDSTVHSAAVTQ